MKKITLLLILLTSALHADPTFLYGNVHAMGGIPMVGLGLRSGSLDLSASALSPSLFHTRALYLIHPLHQGLYIGSGFGMLAEAESIRGVSASAEATIGFQWQTKKRRSFFIEANATAPVEKPSGTARVWPGVTFGFGF